ncbi:MAG TPA: biotin/lipoyl-containing protein [Caulobacteraceae bacterium]
MRHAFILQDIEHLLWLSKRADGGFRLEAEGRSHDVALCPDGRLIVDGETTQIWIAASGDRIYAHVDGEAHELLYRDPISRFAQNRDGSTERLLRAPMPGAVVATPVAPGQTVVAGETLIVIESMKLETAIQSPRDGIVETVHLAVGQAFERDAPLITLAEA